MTRKVVVTGVGMVTPVGHTPEETFDALLAGKTGTRRIEALAEYRAGDKPLDVTIGGEVGDFDPSDYVDKKEARRMDPFILYAQVAAIQAWRDAGLPPELDDDEGERAATLVGVGLAGVGHILDAWETLKNRGPRRISPLFIPSVIGNLAPGHIGMRFNLRGPNWTPASTGCSGAHAYGEGLVHIRDGRSDLLITGGAESVLTPLIMSGFANMGALASDDDPEHACKPFDQNRDGMVLGEGAGILLLEDEARAKARGARIYCELAGYGWGQDDAAANFPQGKGLAQAVRRALDDAGCGPEDIGYVNAHGCAYVESDRREAQALREVFGEHADTLPVSSTKGAIGDLLGGAGAVEAAVTAMAVHKGRIPPTANLEEIDPECGPFDHIKGEPLDKDIGAAVCVNFGVGGINTAVVFKKYEG